MCSTRQPPETIAHALQQQALAKPQTPLFIHDGVLSRYGEIGAEVASLAWRLRRAGLERSARVALLIENSKEYAIAYFAALHAGAVAVPLNTRAPARALLSLLSHCEASWLITAGHYPELANIQTSLPPRIRMIALAAQQKTKARQCDEAIAAGRSGEQNRHEPICASADDCAVLMYTSGTTGRPKGVMLSHRNIIANSLAISDYLELQASDKTLCILPFYYAFGSSLLHTHVLAGAALILVNAPAFPSLWAAAIAEHRATGFSAVPTAYAALLDRVQLQSYDLSSLRYLSQAGGPMSPALVERVRRAVPQAKLFLMYGQTEATARLSYLPPERWPHKKGSVGRPIAGVRLEIRDESGTKLGTGEVGEVWAQGPNLMLGYWKDAELTASVLQDGWLRTGDLGWLDAEGFLFLKGRASALIKTAAHRVSPEEVEEVISGMDGIDEVAVLGISDPSLGQIIRAVVVRRPASTTTQQDVIRHCRRFLPRFKVPKEVVFSTALPRTVTGKVARAGLLHLH